MIEASQRIIGQQNNNHNSAINNRMCSSLFIAVALDRSKRAALEKAEAVLMGSTPTRSISYYEESAVLN
jgi:hypothetical protein